MKTTNAMPAAEGNRFRKILIVEDEASSTTILEKILRSVDPNLEYIWVSSAEDAIEVLKRNEIDLMIVDYNLEGTSTGLDLWFVSRQLFPTIPFVMVSGLGVDRMLKAIGAEGLCPTYISKPLNINRTREILKEFLSPV